MLFLIGLLLEFVCIFGLFVPYVWRVQNGTVVSIRTTPVDPRSIFRGDYVILSYEAGRLSEDEMLKTQNGIIPYGQTVFVTLERNGETFEKVATSESMPVLQPGQVCLRGQYEYMRIGFPDLAQYFVEEGQGLAFEQAQTTNRLTVEASVDDKCRAVILGLTIGEEAPLEPDPMFMPEGIEEVKPPIPPEREPR